MGARKIVGEDRRAPELEVPNGGIAGWFGALFSRPVIVRVALDGLTEFELSWGLSLGKGCRGELEDDESRKKASGRLPPARRTGEQESRPSRPHDPN